MNNSDYSKMSDFEINLRVAEIVVDYDCISRLPYTDMSVHWGDGANWHVFNPYNNPADAWSIIYQNGISIGIYGHGEWGAATINHCHIDGTNPLRAAMIVFLKMQESKNISEEMLNNLEKTLKTENFDTYE